MFAPAVTVQAPAQTAMNAFAVAPSSTPALGNIPTQVVSAPIQTIKVADNRPNGSYQRHSAIDMPSASASFEVDGGMYSDVYLDFPYSTSFLAQLFGQLNMEGSEQGVFFVDYETLAQYEEIKYKPSFAFRPRDSLVADLMEQHQAFLETPQQETNPASANIAGSERQQDKGQTDSGQTNPSLYANGFSAYSAVESRNLLVAVSFSAAQGNRQISAMI